MLVKIAVADGYLARCGAEMWKFHESFSTRN